MRPGTNLKRTTRVLGIWVFCCLYVKEAFVGAAVGLPSCRLYQDDYEEPMLMDGSLGERTAVNHCDMFPVLIVYLVGIYSRDMHLGAVIYDDG